MSHPTHHETNKKSYKPKNQTTIQMSPPNHASPSSFPSCFRPSTDDDHRPLPPPPPASGHPNLTTCLYQTEIGLFSLTWSRTFLGHSLHLSLHTQDYNSHSYSPLSPSLATFTFNLDVKPLTFWRKQGSKKITTTSSIAKKVHVFWDLSRAKFGSGPEPRSGFYIAVVVDTHMVLLVGDYVKQAYARSRAGRKQKVPQALVLRREHVFGNRVFTTKARIGGKKREISMDCRVDEDARLCFSVDGKRVLLVKRLKWKFRGNERVEIDGTPMQVSWDVYNWLFENKDGKKNSHDNSNAHATFMFRFENQQIEEGEETEEMLEKQESNEDGKKGIVLWQQQNTSNSSWSLGLEWRKMRRSFLRSARSSSSSSISMSSASSSGCSSSVMEWASSADEAEFGGNGGGDTHGFSLLIYAWRK